MSDVIQLLPDSVANQIAAGEVIQRPASVIKELVENSIDAGATEVKIILRDAGKTLIQVVDNGCGMSDTDARLAFERHATSKIRQAADLFELHTMGFRGEALPSIAAVAQIDLRTMRRDAQIGSHLELAASKFVSQTPEACTPGCNLSVKNLFFNFPARRKFLKKDSVELSHITREFERLALVNPEVEFELIHNDVTLYQLMPGSLRQRIGGLFGKAVDKQLIPVETQTPLVKIQGFVCSPDAARKRNALQFFFVNGRNMRHPYFHKAVMSCYETLISTEHQPNYFISFEVDPHSIDVNIHPTKSEIKFENELPIWQILAAAVREALGKFNMVPSLDFDPDAPEIPVFNPNADGEPELNIDTAYNPFASNRKTASADPPAEPSRFNSTGYNADPRKTRLDNWDQLYADFNKATSAPVPDGPESFLVGTDLSTSIEASALNIAAQTDAIQPSLDLASTSNDCDSVGLLQLDNRYLVTTGMHSLMIVDRHRAHLKVLFERLLAKTDKSIGESQKVMFGDMITLTSEQMGILDSIADEIKGLGYEYTISRSPEEGIFRCEILAVPAILGHTDPSESLIKIIDDASQETADSREGLHRCLALSLAQSAAIHAGQPQTSADAEHLLSELFSLPDPSFTPDGNPIIYRLPTETLSKKF